MKKILIIILIIVIAIFLFFYFSNSNKNSNNTNTSNNNDLNVSRTSQTNNNVNNTNINTNTNTNLQNNKTVEEPISSYSTKIYTKDSARQNNLGITCSKLNGCIVKSSSSFSFTSVIGPSTSDKGYQEADIFDSNGNKKKGLGGGNCQVSSTLYNAVLGTPGLTVIERHEHSNKVPYVPQGKDAAVAYGSVDFKFKNNNNFDIKISASTDSEKVYITIYKIQ